MEKSEDISSMSDDIYRKMMRNIICSNWVVQAGDKRNYLVMLNYNSMALHHAVIDDPDLDDVIDYFENRILEIEKNGEANG